MNPAREKGKQGMGSPPLPKDWWDLGAAAAQGREESGGQKSGETGIDGKGPKREGQEAHPGLGHLVLDMPVEWTPWATGDDRGLEV